MLKKAKLSRQERRIMQIIYMRGQATLREVADALPVCPPWQDLRAMVRNLRECGRIRRRRGVGAYVYTRGVPVYLSPLPLATVWKPVGWRS